MCGLARLCGPKSPVPPLFNRGRAETEAAKALKLPIIVTTTARDSMWGPTFPELVEALPGIEIIDRSSVNVFENVRVARAIEATGRRKLILIARIVVSCQQAHASEVSRRG
jgi:hypothetical protein